MVDILCNTCRHTEICKYKDDYIKLTENVLRAIDITHSIHGVQVNCEKYKKPIKNPRADYAQIIERGYNNDKY